MAKHHVATDANQSDNRQNLNQGKPEFDFTKQAHG